MIAIILKIMMMIFSEEFELKSIIRPYKMVLVALTRRNILARIFDRFTIQIILVLYAKSRISDR